jgi:hypothetical protein
LPAHALHIGCRVLRRSVFACLRCAWGRPICLPANELLDFYSPVSLSTLTNTSFFLSFFSPSRTAAKTAHPDKGGSEAKMAAVNEAYEVLSKPGEWVFVFYYYFLGFFFLSFFFFGGGDGGFAEGGEVLA